MISVSPEWRILAALASEPASTPELRKRLSRVEPLSRYILSTRLSLLQVRGWLTSQRRIGLGQGPVVTAYAITEQGLAALRRAAQSDYASEPSAVERALERRPGAAG